MVVVLNATDSDGSVQQLTYSAAGTQPIPVTTSTSLPVQVLINTPGVTTLSYGATDKAGNQEAIRSETYWSGVGRNRPDPICLRRSYTHLQHSHPWERRRDGYSHG